MAAGAAAFGAALLLAAPAPPHPFFDRKFDVIAHRGGAGLRPENTLVAFEHAARLGVDVLEMDLRVTSDNVFVVMHDATVDRTTNGTGTVSSFLLKDLRVLDAAHAWPQYRGKGIRVPTLAEVFERFPKARMNLEMKQFSAAQAEALCAHVRRAGMQSKVLVAAFGDEPVRAFRRACPEVATAMTASEARSFAVVSRTYRLPAPGLEIPDGIADLSAAARRRNVKLYLFTVNDEKRMRELIESGVAGIITDRPDLLKAISASYR